jgi:hypothetical protein
VRVEVTFVAAHRVWWVSVVSIPRGEGLNIDIRWLIKQGKEGYNVDLLYPVMNSSSQPRLIRSTWYNCLPSFLHKSHCSDESVLHIDPLRLRRGI